jgi:hypothetical protein
MSWFSRPRAWTCALGLALAAPRSLRAQGWQEAQLWGAGIASRPAFGGLGVALAWRDAGRSRLLASLATGAQSPGGAVRAELAYHFLLDPARTRGNAVYGGGGLALVIGPDGRRHPYVQLLVGAENTPGGRHGTFIEAGLGGGVRVAIGFRWRKRNAPRP